MPTKEAKVLLRRSLSFEWVQANPVLDAGEMGVEIDTLKLKIGNSITLWNDLPYTGATTIADIPGLQTALDSKQPSLGFTPYSDTNPNGFQTAAQVDARVQQVVPATFVDKGNSGTTTQTLDYAAGQHQRVVATGAHTINTSNWPASGKLGEMLLELVNGGSFPVTFSFGTTVNWIKNDGSYANSYATSGVTLQSAGTDWLYLWTRDGGATVQVKVAR